MTVEASAGPDLLAATDLVLQAPSIAADDVEPIVRLSRASSVEPIEGIAHRGYRLHGAHRDERVDVLLATGGLDWAWVPRARTRERVRLVAMDMDSTLITIECIDEIADMQGLKPQVAAITAAAMRGEIDFAESLRRRVALLEGLPVAALERVYDERLRLSPGAEAMLDGFRAVGAKTLLVSGGFTFFTDRLRDRLRLDHTLSNRLVVENGRLAGRVEEPIVDAAAKADALARCRSQYVDGGGLALAIGDGANDLPMLAVADVSVAYRAKPVVRERTTHAIDRCGLDAVLSLFA